MPVIAFDIDGVCYDFVATLRDYICTTYGRNIEEFPDSQTWHFYTDQWGMTLEEYLAYAVEGINARKIFWEGPAEPQSLETINELYDMGYKIIFITARHFKGAEEHGEAATKHWLDTVGYKYHELHVNNDKTGFKFDVLFDDSPHNVEAGRALGHNVVAFDRPWNREHIHFDRVLGWDDIKNYVLEKFPLQVAADSTSG